MMISTKKYVHFAGEGTLTFGVSSTCCAMCSCLPEHQHYGVGQSASMHRQSSFQSCSTLLTSMGALLHGPLLHTQQPCRHEHTQCTAAISWGNAAYAPSTHTAALLLAGSCRKRWYFYIPFLSILCFCAVMIGLGIWSVKHLRMSGLQHCQHAHVCVCVCVCVCARELW